MKRFLSVGIGLLVAVFVLGQAEASLVSYWSFDDDILPPDDVATDSADSNRGEILSVNGGWYSGDGIEQVAGVSGSAMRLLDGIAYMDVWPADNLDPGTGDFSISLWIRKPLLGDWSGEEYIVTYGPGLGAPHYAVYISNNRLYASMSTGNDRPSVAVSGLLDDGRWHHVVAVRYGAMNIVYQNRLYFYVDGVYRDWWTATAWNLVDQHLRIGTYGGPGPWPWHGDIDEVQYYNNALTPDEILALYLSNLNQAPVASCEVGLDDDDVLILDGSGSNDPDGTITLYEWTADGVGIIGNTAVIGTETLVPGIYEVTLTVTDNKGATASCETTLIKGRDKECEDALEAADECLTAIKTSLGITDCDASTVCGEVIYVSPGILNNQQGLSRNPNAGKAVLLCPPTQ